MTWKWGDKFRLAKCLVPEEGWRSGDPRGHREAAEGGGVIVEAAIELRHGVHPTLGSFSVNAKGYPRLNRKPRRYLHRAVFEDVAGRPVRQGWRNT